MSDMDAQNDDPGTEPDASDVADVTTDDIGEPSVEPAAAPLIDWTSPEVAQPISNIVRQAIEDIIGQQSQAEPPAEPGFDWNELNPLDDNYGSTLAEGLKQIIASEIAPLMQFVEQTQQKSALDEANTELTALSVPDDDREFFLRNAIALEQTSDKPLRAQDAIRQATQQIRDRDQRVGRAAVEQYKQSLISKANEPTEPRSGGAGVGVEPAANSLIEAARRFSERQSLAG